MLPEEVWGFWGSPFLDARLDPYLASEGRRSTLLMDEHYMAIKQVGHEKCAWFPDDQAIDRVILDLADLGCFQMDFASRGVWCTAMMDNLGHQRVTLTGPISRWAWAKVEI